MSMTNAFIHSIKANRRKKKKEIKSRVAECGRGEMKGREKEREQSHNAKKQQKCFICV